jgi:toxin-antitoxin system PIN domain toxin
MTSADSNIFTYALNANSPYFAEARRFLSSAAQNGSFATCELVLVELYMNLRNPAVMKKKQLPAAQAQSICQQYRNNPAWQHLDYEPAVSASLWEWAKSTKGSFRQIIDARLALTLRHHGVTHFATHNAKDFRGFGFEKVWSPLIS